MKHKKSKFAVALVGLGIMFKYLQSHIATEESKVTESIFVAKSMSPEEKVSYRELKKILREKGYDDVFLRMRLSSQIEYNSAGAKAIIKDVLSADSWESKKAVLQGYNLLKKRSVFLITQENKGWILYAFVVLIILFLTSINYSIR